MVVSVSRIRNGYEYGRRSRGRFRDETADVYFPRTTKFTEIVPNATVFFFVILH